MIELMAAAEVAADRAGWLKRRAGDEQTGALVGASDIGKIIGARGARGSAYRLWAEKTGQFIPDDDALPDVVEFGNYCEPFAEYLLAKDQPGWHVTPGGLYASDARPWMIATFDRIMHLAGDWAGCPDCAAYPPAAPAAPVQLKNSAFTDWTGYGAAGPPPAYVAQVIWETAVMGADRGYLIPFDRNAVRIGIIEIRMDDRARASLAMMIAAAEEFRAQVASRTPPAVDGSEATTEALKAMTGDIDKDATVVLPRRLAERWFAAITADAATEERRRTYLNQLLAKAGNAGTWTVREPDGALTPIATRSKSPRGAHWVKGNPAVDTVRPRRSWNGGRPQPAGSDQEGSQS